MKTEYVLSNADIENGFRRGLSGWCPPIIARIPYDEMTREYQVDGVMPASRKGPFADAIDALGQYFTGGQTGAQATGTKRASGLLSGLRMPAIKIQ